jgi:RNA polymerase sigma factor (sigma-70 family)
MSNSTRNAMTDDDPLFNDLKEGRQRFLALVEDIRPDLHRYCARMVGSVADGEDLVQETLARAYYELGELKELPALRAWLFRIAHHRALDHLRRYERRMGQSLEALDDAAALPADPANDAELALASAEAVQAALARFLELPPIPRSCVILKDVLGCSLDEMTATLALSSPAVKAALHRGRARLRELAHGEDAAAKEAAPAAGTQGHGTRVGTRARSGGQDAPPARAHSRVIARYAALFNARDWDGVRALLAEDVRLDLVSRWKRAGHRDVSSYYGNYDKVTDWLLVPAWLEGREVLAVLRDPADQRPSYFMELTTAGDHVVAIRDFRYVPYIARDAAFDFPR